MYCMYSNLQHFSNATAYSYELVVLQTLWWCCVDCVIHHERDVREEQHHTYIWREQAIIERPLNKCSIYQKYKK